jgi:hypothetical protein
MPARRRAITLILLALAVVALLAAAWLWRGYRQAGYLPERFDAVKWKAALVSSGTSDPACVRGGMALDLIQHQTLTGKSAPQVLELLGAPDEQGPTYWTYHLGECPGWGWNDSDLRLNFDTATTQVQSATFEHVTVPESR